MGISELYRKSIWLFLALTVGIPVSAQQRTSECLQVIKDAYRTMCRPLKPGEAFDVRYVVRSVPRDTTRMQQGVLEIHAVMTQDRMDVTSNRIEVYKDKTTALTVVPGAQTIYIADSDWDRSGSERTEQIQILRDTLLTSGRVLECGEVRETSGIARRSILVEPPVSIRRRYHMATVKFILDEHGALGSMIVVYDASMPLNRVEISIRSMEFRRIDASLERSVSTVVFEGDHLAPRYRAYKIVDKRIRSRR